MRALIAALAALMATAPAVGAPPAASWKGVRGKALQKMFADRELGDGVHYAYQFRANGTFTGTEMAKDVRGTWRVTGREICWTWTRPRGAEECYTARRNGSEVSLLRNGSEQWYGTLKPIQAARQK